MGPADWLMRLTDFILGADGVLATEQIAHLAKFSQSLLQKYTPAPPNRNPTVLH
jgi:hypothetical protein